ncbi:hypothetical protein BJ165DRAFT_1562214, partial [Panaeolus papilionaceus]
LIFHLSRTTGRLLFAILCILRPVRWICLITSQTSQNSRRHTTNSPPSPSKLEDGYETRLDPMQESFSVDLYNDKQHPLAKELEGLRKTIDVSVGEKQSLRAYMMRFHSNPIKFVAVDEPSSALDAEA